MAWTTPRTWVATEVPTAAIFNTHVRDNLAYLLSGMTLSTVVRDNGADYTTSSTSFADIDGTNLIATITPQTGRVVCLLSGNMKISTAPASMYFDWIVDSTTRAGNASYGSFGWTFPAAQGGAYTFNVIAKFSGLSVASHTFKPQWRVTTGTGTIYCNAYTVALLAWEA